MTAPKIKITREAWELISPHLRSEGGYSRAAWSVGVEIVEDGVVVSLSDLKRIRSWDCLNPPRADLLADLPWLARELDAMLAAAQKEGKR